MVLTQANSISSALLEAPINPQLLVTCRVAYPFREIPLDSGLRGFYSNVQYNLGQASKCYDKDEELVEEVNKK